MMDELFSVAGKVIVISGGLGQLGRNFSVALADRGAKIAIFDFAWGTVELPASLKPFEKLGSLMGMAVDVSNRRSIEYGLESVWKRWGAAPEGLINNAALDSPPNASESENGPFEQYPEASWDAVMSVNLKGVFQCCQVLGGAMAEAGRGSIVNISSTYGLVSPDQRIYEFRRVNGADFYKPAAYSASKSALLNLTRYLATYWAGKGVRVNTLTFGGVFSGQDAVFMEAYCKRVPLGRMACENEYNGAAIFLLSDASSYMTGSNMVLDGGWTAW